MSHAGVASPSLVTNSLADVHDVDLQSPRLACLGVHDRRRRLTPAHLGNVVIALAIDATPYFALVTACCLVFGVITSDMPLTLVSAAVAICQRARDAASLSSEVFPRHLQSAPLVMIPDR